MDTATGDRPVRNECALVWEHVVCCTRISNKETVVAGMILVKEEHGGVGLGVWRSAMMSLGSWTVQTPCGLMDNVVWRQLVGDSEAVSRGLAVVWEACG